MTVISKILSAADADEDGITLSAHSRAPGPATAKFGTHSEQNVRHLKMLEE